MRGVLGCAVIAAAMAGCQDGDPKGGDEEEAAATEEAAAPTSSGAIACLTRADLRRASLDRGPIESLFEAARQKGFPDPDSIWKQASLRVCWMDDGFAREKAMVRDAVEATWGAALRAAAARGRLRFEGWDRCRGRQDGEVRIAIRDEEPRTIDLGRRNDTRRGGANVVLNFVQRDWTPKSGCRGKPIDDVIRTVAVHEFGHVLGLAHEQDRPDYHRDCESSGRAGTCTYCPPDDDSIMNYCRVSAACSPTISACDRASIVELYSVYR